VHPILTAARSQMIGLVEGRSAMATAADKVEPFSAAGRKRVLMRGTLLTPAGAFAVWIRDISAVGALVTSKDRLPASCDAILRRGGIFAAGYLTREKDDSVSVKFYRELGEDVLASATALHSAGE
jgi:hypothetical protein